MTQVTVPLSCLTDRALLELIANQQMELIIMANQNQQSIDELKSTMGDLGTALDTMHTAVVAALTDIVDNADDADQIRTIATEARAKIGGILADAAALTPAGQAPNPPAEGGGDEGAGTGTDGEDVG